MQNLQLKFDYYTHSQNFVAISEHLKFKNNDYVIEYFLAVQTVKSRVERFFSLRPGPLSHVLCGLI